MLDRVHLLRELSSKARNAVVGGGLPIDRVRDQYLAWVEQAETQLRSRFSSEVWRELFTDRYWHIQRLDESSARPFPVVNNEASYQADRLERMATRLDELHRRFSVASDCALVIPDTNVLLHYRRFDEILWLDILDKAAVRLVIPLVVIDELDDLSFRSNPVSDRARSVLRSLRRHRAELGPDDPSELRRGVSMQVLLDPPEHQRLANNDAELLDRVEYLKVVTGRESILVTADYGLQLRASAREIEWQALPDELRLASS